MTAENIGEKPGAQIREMVGSPHFGLWDRLGGSGEALPFFTPNMDMKSRGFVVQFLSPVPRRESQNRFNLQAIDCWFDIHYVKEVVEPSGFKSFKAEKRTWTISQISLLSELKKYAPLNNKIFQIRLVRVDAEWKKRFPNFRGMFRYDVKLLGERVFPSESVGMAKTAQQVPASEAAPAPVPVMAIPPAQPMAAAHQPQGGHHAFSVSGQTAPSPMPAMSGLFNPLERPVVEEVVA